MLPEEAEATIPRNIITQCLGDPDGIMPDVYVADLTGRFIICSDGLHGEVPDEQIGGHRRGAFQSAGGRGRLGGGRS